MFHSKFFAFAALRSFAAIGLLGLAGVVHAAGALSVTREVEVDAAPATVWKMIGHYNHLDVWHPALSGSTLKGSATTPGSIRTLTLAGGGEIVEKLLSHSDGKMSYSYTILSSPLPVQNYRSTVSVRSAGAGKSMVTWTGSFDAKGAPEDKAKETIQGIYDAGLAKIAANFKK